MTQLNITFSQSLVGPGGTYLQPGVWVDAVYFTGSGANWTQLVENGVAQTGTSITLPEVYSGGKVYLIVSSGPSTSSDPIQAVISQESDISIAAAEANNYRFDSIELTLNGSGAAAINDVANLTSVVGFGLPMQLSTSVAANGSVGYDISGSAIFSAIQAILPSSSSAYDSLVFPFVSGPLGSAGVDRYGTAPASASQLTVPPFPAGTTAPFQPSDWANYVGQFQQTLNQPTLYMAGFFNGAPDANGIWHNQGFYNYSLSYDGTNFWLNPAANSQIKGSIQISPSELENSIYATNANVFIYPNSSSTTPYTIFDPNPATQSDEMNVGDNNQWGDVLKELFTGFSGGFWGATAPSVNSLVSTSVDLSNNWNWDPTYAFGGGGTSNTTNFDEYSEIFFAHSNSYGSGYSDNLMALYRTGGPLLSIYDSTTGADVAQLNLTVYGDGDTPAGYTTPVIYNYLAPSPTGSGYVAPLSSSAGAAANSLSMTLDFSADAGASGQTTWTLDQTNAQVTLNVLTGIANNVPSWTPIQLTASAGGGSLWWNWQISANGMGGYTAAPITNTAQDPGSLVISGMPINTSQGNGITWYQIVVSALDGSSAKTFNLYTTLESDPNTKPGVPVVTASASSISGTTLTIGGSITNPQDPSATPPPFAPGMPITGNGIPDGTSIVANLSGSGGAGTYQINTSLNITTESISGTAASTKVSQNGYGFVPEGAAQQIDGGAIIAFSPPVTPFISDPTITVNFQNGVFTSIDPSLLVMGAQPSGNTIPMLGAPSAPVAGTVSAGTFTVLSNTSLGSPDSISATTTASSVAIGWVGLYGAAPVLPTYNSDGSYNAGWVTSYTNKVSGLNYAYVSATNTSTGVTTLMSMTQGDIDGQWQTAAFTLTPGSYTVTMQEFVSTSSVDPVSNVSAPLALTIEAAQVDIASGGTHINAVASGPLEPGVQSGVWIDIALLTSSASLPQGSTLLLYGTDASGHLVGRHGETGSGVTLQDAILARIGPAQGDNGHDLMVPLQSVFLPATGQLHVAVLGKDGSIDSNPTVNITGSAGGILDVSVAGVHLSAREGNDRANETNLAAVQRSDDLPLLLLTHGAEVTVHIAGSAANTNSLGFVHLEIDSAGNLSVGGVAYGPTQAFTNAVLANLDSGFSFADGGRTFDRSESWIVAGPTGYYAPVMTSQSGDVFVLGTANPDGRDHIRLLGENIFGIEDLTTAQHGDFDYNDMLVGVHLQAAPA